MIDTPGSIDLSLAVVAAVLVGFPLAYVAQVLTPWSRRLWRDGEHDAYVEYWALTVAMHWASAAAVVGVLWYAGYGLDAVGLTVPSGPVLWATIALAAGSVGLYALWVFPARPLPVDDLDGEPYEKGYLPGTTGERVLYLFASVTAGFSEELVYRGFALGALVGLGAPLWLAVCLSTLSFVGMHGLANLNPFAAVMFTVYGLAFAGVYLLAGSLVPAMVVHGTVDLLVVAWSTNGVADALAAESTAG